MLSLHKIACLMSIQEPFHYVAFVQELCQNCPRSMQDFILEFFKKTFFATENAIWVSQKRTS